jgi:hypothetical protein
VIVIDTQTKLALFGAVMFFIGSLFGLWIGS